MMLTQIIHNTSIIILMYVSSSSVYFPLTSIYIYMHQRNKTEEKKEVEPQGQALAKRTCRKKVFRVRKKEEKTCALQEAVRQI